MKIILSTPAHNNSEGAPLFTKGQCPLHTIPDTALLGNKRPFFIPDFALRCAAQLLWAVRICRLGRSINERFAHRYYDAMTAAVHFTAHPLLEQLQEQALPWDMACGFDSSLAVGSFQPINLQAADEVTLRLTCNDAETAALHLPAALSVIDRTIAFASQFYTLRQGDIFLIGQHAKQPEVAIDDHLVASCQGHDLLSFNVK